MTYLTRFEINAARRGARWLLDSPQRMHAAVMTAFPAADAALPGRILWRIDIIGPRQYLYLLSPAPPDLTHLVEQAGWPTRSTWDTRDYLPLLDRLGVGQRWAFRLRANPTHSAIVGDRRKRLGHVTIVHKTQWLLDRAARCGFKIPASGAGAPDVVVSESDLRAFNRSGKTVTLALASYDGTLEVVDADLLRAALLGGVGRAKAYGCGLLTLARA